MEGITYGDYFQAAADFLLADEAAVLARAAAIVLEQPGVHSRIERVAIHLVKHGAFYHPARVTWRVEDVELQIVLNVAVSAAGRAVIPTEFDALQRLWVGPGCGLVPRVFACGRGGGADATRALPMFAAQWMDDFHELHLTTTPAGAGHRWVVWHAERGALFLTGSQVFQFYRRAIHILTRCFNPFTLEAILDWHHASGDFVVAPDTDPLQVRLITVRRYAPIFVLDGDRPPDLQIIVEALAAFFMRTSLWMRIDRIDGVGELVWAETPDLPAALLAGFLAGLADMACLHGLPQNFTVVVHNYLAAQSGETLRALAEAIAARLDSGMDEKQLLQTHLEDHVAAFCALLAR